MGTRRLSLTRGRKGWACRGRRAARGKESESKKRNRPDGVEAKHAGPALQRCVREEAASFFGRETGSRIPRCSQPFSILASFIIKPGVGLEGRGRCGCRDQGAGTGECIYTRYTETYPLTCARATEMGGMLGFGERVFPARSIYQEWAEPRRRACGCVQRLQITIIAHHTTLRTLPSMRYMGRGRPIKFGTTIETANAAATADAAASTLPRPSRALRLCFCSGSR